MKKSDLKTGMIVVTRDGGEHMVILNVEYANIGSNEPRNVIVSECGWMSLAKYSDDLKVENTPELDIVAVYLPLITASLCLWRKNASDKYSWKCIWKREEPPVEMTVAEIEEKLGIKNLKIIKEHKDE